MRLEVYLSNQEYSNLAAACFEPIFFRCFFIIFSLKGMLNKTVTAISQNLWKQQIFYSEWSIHHSPIKRDALKCLERYQIHQVSQVTMNQTLVMHFVAGGQLKKNPGFFQIESRLYRELETILWKSPAIGVHLFF